MTILQEQLCNMKGDSLTLKMFFDEACVAEQKRKSFQEIGVSSSHLDLSAGVSVNKWEPRHDRSGGSDKSGEKSDKWCAKSKWNSGGKSDKAGSDVTKQRSAPQGSGRSHYPDHRS